MINPLMKDSLTNLALLPKKENIAKKNKALNEITDAWLKNLITIYEGIQETDFVKYSDITHIDDLTELRGKMFADTFGKIREYYQINYFRAHMVIELLYGL
jgi:hypothetical protein